MDKETRNELLKEIDSIMDALAGKGMYAAEDVVTALRSRNEALWDKVRDDLASERMAAIARPRMTKPVKSLSQIPLPGYEHVPLSISINRQRVVIHKANIEQLKQYTEWYTKVVEKREEKKAAEGDRLRDLEKLIRIVRPFSRKNPEITVEEVFVLRQQRIDERKARSKAPVKIPYGSR